jgi:phosphoenolpyruvate synthase/pyruvate phosphate dikinase
LLRILEAKGKRYAGRFARNYQVLTTFGGYREIHKFYIIRAGDLLRERILDVAQTLTRAGRLDNLGQAFALTIEELDRARVEPNLDVRALAKKNTHFLRRVNRVHDFPRIIDSRGKILRPPRLEAKQGLLAGQPISPGVVRGRVRVLSQPEEEMIQPGEILVARATDPGWTPLFLNAGGIILEVGGILQHGALVAREYCKPCIAGLEGATKLFSTGQLVELDGANGTVRRLEEVEA